MDRRLESLDGGAESVDREVDEEFRFHLQGRVDELVAAGWDPHEAEIEARRRFGDLPRFRRDSRDERVRAVRQRVGRVRREALVQDLWLAWRELRRQPRLGILVVVGMAVGIGFSAALFGLVDPVLLRPLPYPEPDRLVHLWQYDRATGTLREPVGSADFFDFQGRTSSFEFLAMVRTGSGNLRSGAGEPAHVGVVEGSAELARVLGIAPLLGRWPDPRDPEAAGTILLGEELWTRHFGGDPAVVGRTVSLDGHPRVVTGVLPAGAAVAVGNGIEAWVPLEITPAEATRSPHEFTVVGRLVPGTGVEEASGEVATLALDMEGEDPENRNRGAMVERVDTYLRGGVAGTFQALVGAVLLLLVLTALNVSTLLLARANSRVRETAVHAALGAGTFRAARRTLAGVLLLSLVGGLLGIALAGGLMQLLEGLVPPSLRSVAQPGLNPRVLGLALVLVVVLTSLAGAGPALRAARTPPGSALSGARGALGAGVRGRRAGEALVVVQAAIAAVLLVGATLLGTTLVNLYRVDPGFRTDDIVRLTFSLPEGRYPADFSVYPVWPERLRLQADVLDGVQGIPGVEAAALVLNHPLDPGFTNSFSVEGRVMDPGRGEMTTRMITPGYFDVAELRLLEGRLLRGDEEVDDPPVVVINRAAAQRHFPDGDALGSRMAFWGPTPREIVGIVENERVQGLRAEAPAAFYTSLAQTPAAGGELTLMVRSPMAPEVLVPRLREVLRSVDPDLPVYDITTMDATLAVALARERFSTTLMVLFGAMALTLAALGVHGVLSHEVGTRTRELGVRLALGATATGVGGMVLRRGLLLVGLGALAGLILARAGARGLEALLFQVDGGNPLVYLGIGGVLLLVAGAAALVPALRAARVDPGEALRSDA